MADTGQRPAQNYEDGEAPDTPEDRAYVARKPVGAHKKFMEGDEVWLNYPDGRGPYAVVIVEAQFVAGTKPRRMKYRVKYKGEAGEVVNDKGNEWFTQDCVSKE
ncbi:hypothetical protein LTR56_011813 [Elasticomyces elasticus]|nr:hypothetical protein LTR56_011813 [Elasticomyces elasticus]KAK3666457.1 hypothetical protein LTR22_002762 [Elasticomyces elasticus]KAK4931277.1 hypothetical protein LTR49_002335 [Elasticomyces elasticus]KAK5767791.1 hypothetical protein LTS12_001943 [Elasticomyces elasticus]